MRTITLVAYNRPDYTKATLDSLVAANIDDYQLYIGVEPGDQDTIDVCKSTQIPNATVLVHKQRHGINYHNKFMYDYVFSNGSDFNIAIEDDTPIAPDALYLAKWFEEWHLSNRYVGLNLFNNSKSNERPFGLFETEAFCPWGYCMSKSAYMNYIAPNWMCDNRGWDWSICNMLTRLRLKFVSPFLSRSKNIGRLKGTYCTPDFHDSCFAGHVCSSFTKPGDYLLENLS